jgi:uncharacterized protein YndB with AHSA1/START domain
MRKPVVEPVVVREVELDATVEEVWALLTEPAELGTWLGTDVRVAHGLGADGSALNWALGAGTEASLLDAGVARRLVVGDIDPGRRLGFVWWPDDEPALASAVSFTITREDQAGPCRLRIEERPLATAGARACSLADAASAWDDRLLGLELRLLTKAVAFAGAGLARL